MSDPKAAAEDLFRTKYGEVLAALLRFAGYQHMELAEEAVQAAFARALEKWSDADLPDNPAGWLYTVARRNYLESQRRAQTERDKLAQVRADRQVASAAFPSIHDNDVHLVADAAASPPPDDLAVMILLCCNPELSPKAQVCLTLKAACGFSIPEIARALGMQEEATKKTITRARTKVTGDREVFTVLDPVRIQARFGLVLETLYALFNEGYAASRGEVQLRRDVAEEAIHLVNVFLKATITPDAHRGALHALLALMLLQFARFDARISPSGVPIRLQEQDRSQWNRNLIHAGMAALRASQASAQITPFHLEARIAAEHATSVSFQTTDWPAILALYDQLLHLKETPEVRLSRIVALRYVQGWEAALDDLDQLEANTVARSFLLHAIRADLLESAGRASDAAAAWQIARTHAPTTADLAFIDQKLADLA